MIFFVSFLTIVLLFYVKLSGSEKNKVKKSSGLSGLVKIWMNRIYIFLTLYRLIIHHSNDPDILNP